jgi:TM2 domain-containing membrane protein YozV
MLKSLLTRTLLSCFLFFTIITTANAAFPLEKQVNQVVTTSTTVTASEKSERKSNKKELKTELRKFKKDKTYWYSGGKSKMVAALLAFFLGGLGIHSFYMGKTKKGFIQLGLSVAGIVLYVVGIVDYVSGLGESFPTLALIGLILLFGVSLWAFIDFIRILTGGLEPEEGWAD